MTAPDRETELKSLGDSAREAFTRSSAAREEALRLCREVIRFSANAIRALHRREWDEADALLARAREQASQAAACLRDFPEVFYAGFLHDAQKEYAEASTTRALVLRAPLPTHQELAVELPAYLNGLGEATGELRRYILDSLRRGEVDTCEELLDAMDAVYTLLVALDFPDALTGGLRRTTDMVRGVVERTRGDLTMALLQRDLSERLEASGHRRVKR